MARTDDPDSGGAPSPNPRATRRAGRGSRGGGATSIPRTEIPLPPPDARADDRGSPGFPAAAALAAAASRGSVPR